TRTAVPSSSLYTPPAFFSSLLPRPPRSTLFPYTTLFRFTRQFSKMSSVVGEERMPSFFSFFPNVKPSVPFSTMNALMPLCLASRSEEHTSELQSRFDLVCRLLLEKKKNIQTQRPQLTATH